MKYLIASDIHGSAYWAERLVAAIESEQPDRIVLLGDLLYHGPRNDLPRDYNPKEVTAILNGMKRDGTLAALYEKWLGAKPGPDSSTVHVYTTPWQPK